MKLLNVSILTISSILAVSSGHAAKEVSNKAVGADVSNLKSTGYIDIERIKRENPVPDVDIAKQQKKLLVLLIVLKFLINKNCLSQ